MRDDAMRDGGVTVHARGHVSAAEHVYAHDRVAQLRRIVPGAGFQGEVRIDADRDTGDGVSVAAACELRFGDRVVQANVEAPTITDAVDALHERLREGIEAQSR
jgi:ribosome-associated translation inhibitor RaiA